MFLWFWVKGQNVFLSLAVKDMVSGSQCISFTDSGFPSLTHVLGPMCGFCFCCWLWFQGHGVFLWLTSFTPQIKEQYDDAGIAFTVPEESM